MTGRARNSGGRVALGAWKKALFSFLAANVPLFVEETGTDGRTYLKTSPAKTAWFNRQRFLKDKPADVSAAEVDAMLARSIGPEDYVRDDSFHAQVLAHYRSALRLDPRSVDAHINLGAELVTRGEIRAGIEHFREALKPGLAGALPALGRDEEALQELRRALRRDPEFAAANPEIRELLE